MHLLDLDPPEDFAERRPKSVEDLKEVRVGPTDRHVTKVGTTLSVEQECKLVHFLGRNLDVFAWSPTDLKGVDPDFMCHRLALDPNAKPVAQRKRQFREEKRRAITLETE